MKYAVLDWDNTIRKKFTLFSWMDFLYENEVINKNLVSQDIEFTQSQYALKEISHDDYARIACEIYAKAMSGIRKKDYDTLLHRYIEKDRKDIFVFSKSIFDYLYKSKIAPIIISGAPTNILNQYIDEFNIYKIYAFSEAFKKGICTGAVKYNYGVNKRKTLERLIRSYGYKPCIAFGDSSSDIPLFDLSSHAFCIIDDKASIGKYGSKPIYVSNEITGEGIISLIQEELRKGL